MHFLKPRCLLFYLGSLATTGLSILPNTPTKGFTKEFTNLWDFNTSKQISSRVYPYWKSGGKEGKHW